MTDREKIKTLATEVMGWESISYTNIGDGWLGPDGGLVKLQNEWNPLVRISDTWLIVDKLKSFPYDFELNRDEDRWVCILNPYELGGKVIWQQGATAQEVICAAALEVVSIRDGHTD